LSQWQVSLWLPCKTDAFTEDMSITNFEATDDFGCTQCSEGYSFARFVVQLSIVCSNSTAGDEALQAAASALFQCENRESDVTDSNGKPKLLWSLFYVQATSNPWVSLQLCVSIVMDYMSSFLSLPSLMNSRKNEMQEESTDKGSCGMPDGTLDYKTMMALTEIICILAHLCLF
jgi:hypothetical protein